MDITLGQLSLIVDQKARGWRAALSSVGGIYLITEPETGKSYVGKASGADGLWGRFENYARTTHGSNRGLVEQIEAIGVDVAKDWRFTILEVFDTGTQDAWVLARESHWKRVLMTRTYGYNEN